MNCRPKKIKKRYDKKRIKKRLEKNRLEFIVKKYEESDKNATIVIKKVSFITRVFEFFLHMLYMLGRLSVWVILCVLITIGVNTLLNVQIGEQFIHLLRQIGV